MCNIGVTFGYGVGVKTGCQNTQNLDIWRWEEVFAWQNNVSDYIVLYKLCVKGTYVHGMCLRIWCLGVDLRIYGQSTSIYTNILFSIKEFSKISILVGISLCKTAYLFVALSLSLCSQTMVEYIAYALCRKFVRGFCSWCSVWLIELLGRCQIPTCTYCPLTTYLQDNDFQFTLFGLNCIHRDYSSDLFTEHCLYQSIYPKFCDLVMLNNN